MKKCFAWLSSHIVKDFATQLSYIRVYFDAAERIHGRLLEAEGRGSCFSGAFLWISSIKKRLFPWLFSQLTASQSADGSQKCFTCFRSVIHQGLYQLCSTPLLKIPRIKLKISYLRPFFPTAVWKLHEYVRSGTISTPKCLWSWSKNSILPSISPKMKKKKIPQVHHWPQIWVAMLCREAIK